MPIPEGRREVPVRKGTGMSVMDEFKPEDDAALVVVDLVEVDEDGEPVGEVLMEEIVTFDSEGNEQVVYESVYVVDEESGE